MGRFTYYAPLWLGTALAAVMLLTYRGLLALADWQFWLLLCVGSPLVGLVCQLAMIGVQGAFAQVLPVPGGRSLRGRPAMLAGAALLAALALGSAGALLAIERVGPAAITLGVLALAATFTAIIVYAWNLPTAVRDFTGER